MAASLYVLGVWTAGFLLSGQTASQLLLLGKQETKTSQISENISQVEKWKISLEESFRRHFILSLPRSKISYTWSTCNRHSCSLFVKSPVMGTAWLAQTQPLAFFLMPNWNLSSPRASPLLFVPRETWRMVYCFPQVVFFQCEVNSMMGNDWPHSCCLNNVFLDDRHGCVTAISKCNQYGSLFF